MESSPIIRTAIIVTGSFDPAAITQATALTPTHTFRAGDSRGGSPTLRHVEDVWQIVVNDRPSLHIDEELSLLCALVQPVADQFREALRSLQLTAQASLSVNVAGCQFPSISLSRAQLKQLSELHLSIDIDII